MPLQVFNLACALKRITELLLCIMHALACAFSPLDRASEKQTRADKSQTDAGNYAEPYSDTPVWVPSLRRRQLGSIEPH